MKVVVPTGSTSLPQVLGQCCELLEATSYDRCGAGADNPLALQALMKPT